MRKGTSFTERDLLNDREQCFKKLDEDLITVLEFKAYVVGLHPCQVLQKNIKMLFLHQQSIN